MERKIVTINEIIDAVYSRPDQLETTVERNLEVCYRQNHPIPDVLFFYVFACLYQGEGINKDEANQKLQNLAKTKRDRQQVNTY